MKIKNKEATEILEKISPMLINKTETKDMSNGMRDTSGTLLTNEEISYIIKEIKRIEADESIFVFNDEQHIKSSTCYNFIEDKIYVTRNVFPDTKYASSHPKDLMSVAAVLSHEYYGHRTYRQEYLNDLKQGKDHHTTPLWEDECRASITAAKIGKNLTQKERCDLINDASYRAQEAGMVITIDDSMKEIMYGYNNDEKNISYPITPINFVSEASLDGISTEKLENNQMSKMQRYNYNRGER